MENYNFDRFKEAQTLNFGKALREIRAGRRKSHWSWFVFPQLKGLGHSFASAFYGLEGLPEAVAYLKDKELSDNLITASKALLELPGHDIHAIMGTPGDLKVRSSMTLFYHAADDDRKEVFKAVIDKFYKGAWDDKTEKMIA